VLVICASGQDDRAGEVEDEEQLAARRQRAGLGQRVRDQDQECTGELDRLRHEKLLSPLAGGCTIETA
jgi:hypothetical protein